MIDAYTMPLLGGLLLGTGASMLLLLNGKIAGASGLVAGLFNGRITLVNLAFVLGLIVAPVLFVALDGTMPAIEVSVPMPLVVVAGLLVGYGARMGSGCTSGHGILGLARLSKRSLAAVVTFITTGVLTVTLAGMVL